MKTKNINFYKAFHEKKKMSATDKKNMLFVLPIVAICVAFGGVAIKIQMDISKIDSKTAQEKAYVSNIKITQDYNDALAAEEKIKYLRSLSLQLKDSKTAMESDPTLNEDLFNLIKEAAGKNVFVCGYIFDGASGMLTLQIFARDVFEVSQFAERVDNLNKFSEISYTGYTIEDEELDFNSPYTFELNCSVSGNAPMEGGVTQ